MPNKKRAVVLHGYKANPYVNWYPWLAWKLRNLGYDTWAPWLPMSSSPSGKNWTRKLLSRKDWNYTGSLVIGHSAGAVELLNLLSNLPKGQKIDTAVFIGIFRPKSHWPALKNLHENFDPVLIAKNAKRLIFIHAKDDPLCPLADAEFYSQKTGGELIVLRKGGHFSMLRNISYWRFPKLIDILKEQKVL